MSDIKYYRVQKSAPGVRQFLTGAMSIDRAYAHMMSIAANLEKNGYIRKENREKTIVILGKDARTVALRVVECSADDIVEASREAVAPYAVQTYDLSADEDTRELAISAETPVDGLFDMRDGTDDYEQESAGAA